MKQLQYRGYSITECKLAEDCTCSYCQSALFIIKTLRGLLQIAVDSQSIPHFWFLAVNCNYDFKEAAKQLGIEGVWDDEDKVLH